MSSIEGLVDLRKRRINTIRNYIQDAQEARLKRFKVLQTRKVAYEKKSGHALVSLSLGVHASSLFSLCFGAHASSLHHPVEDPPSPVLTQHVICEWRTETRFIAITSPYSYSACLNSCRHPSAHSENRLLETSRLTHDVLKRKRFLSFVHYRTFRRTVLLLFN